MATSPQENYVGGEKASRKCPLCHSEKRWKDGIRKTRNGAVQRYICRECGYRFSETSVLSTNPYDRRERQVGATLTEAKNLTKVQPLRSGLAGATKLDKADVKGKVVEFAWWMKKEGYSKSTIKTYSGNIRRLVSCGVDIRNPEEVKECLAKQDLSNAHKNVIIAGYTLFLQTQGMTWNPPICNVSRKLPFIPTERELDDLIAGCGKKTATFLQMLKETAMRKGEASRLKWTDVDLQRKTLILNNPEKNGTPRVFNISNRLVYMLSSLQSRMNGYSEPTAR